MAQVFPVHVDAVSAAVDLRGTQLYEVKQRKFEAGLMKISFEAEQGVVSAGSDFGAVESGLLKSLLFLFPFVYFYLDSSREGSDLGFVGRKKIKEGRTRVSDPHGHFLRARAPFDFVQGRSAPYGTELPEGS